MTGAKQIEELFEDYLDSAVRRGALLINGEWGTGKTQIAITKLKPLAEAQGFKTAYVSIAEIDSLDGFEVNLFIASHHWLAKGSIKSFAEMSVETARHWGKKFGIPIDSLITSRNKYSSGTLVFIDDLERAPRELRKRILYRLASLQELSGAKTVILADESKITKEEDEDYNSIKEKVVARTIEYCPTYADIAQIAVQVVLAAPPKKAHDKQKWALLRHIDDTSLSELLASTLESGSCRNLRSAIAAATEACELFEYLAAAYPGVDATVARSLTHSCAAFVIELRSNRSHSADLRIYVEATTDVKWFKFLSSGSLSKDYLLSFDSKFGQGIGCEIIRSNAILDFVEKGSCDLDRLHQDVLSLRPKDDSVFAYRRLNRYRALSTEDFTRLTDEALSEIASLKIRSFQLISESAQTLFHLAEKDLLLIKAVELRIRYVECLNKLAEEYLQGQSDIQLDYDATLASAITQSELRIVYEHLQKKADQLALEKFKRAKVAELEKLALNPDAFVASLNSVDSQLARRSCLEPEDAHLILQILTDVLSTHQEPHVVFYKVERAIRNRYLSSSIGVNFSSEIHFLEFLQKDLRSLAADSRSALLKDALTSLQETLAVSVGSFGSKR